jgi:nucleotide-binding universal stress UspA family protein
VPYEILNAAEDEQADLVVLCTHGRTGVEHFFLGSVTEQVLRMASVDILAMPAVQPA